VYSRARTIYLDDILSAVDAHTAQFIFEECLTGSLLRGRTVVLVTHHVGLCLPGADYLVMLTRDGVIDRACPAAEARLSDTDLIALGSPGEDRIDESPLSPRREVKDINEPKRNLVARQHYTAENQAAGRVASSHYMLVFRAAGGWAYWFVLIGLLTGARGVSIWQMLWMEQWSGDPDPSAVGYYIAHYAGITLLGLVLGSVRWVWLYGVGNVGFYNAGSRRIHSMLLDRICGAPMSFFETTPGGRLMNLFGQDINRLDSQAADDFGRECGPVRNETWLRLIPAGTVMQGLVVVSAAIIITINSPVSGAVFKWCCLPVRRID
jgi:ABC-type multidrug transport system fused ATPase/permease subunit